MRVRVLTSPDGRLQPHDGIGRANHRADVQVVHVSQPLVRPPSEEDEAITRRIEGHRSVRSSLRKEEGRIKKEEEEGGSNEEVRRNEGGRKEEGGRRDKYVGIRTK